MFGTSVNGATATDVVLHSVGQPPTPASIAGLRGLNVMTRGTGLPRLDEQAIERMIHRDTLNLLHLNER